MIKKYIIITSINNPTKAIKSFAGIDGYQLVVVGDKKTPTDWNFPGVKYLSVKDQQNLGLHIGGHLPYNHYCRKMIGYLYAMQNESDFIIDTDDDNIPKKDWGFPLGNGKYKFITGKKGFVNVYKFYSDQDIWPRGLPLDEISGGKIEISESEKLFNVGIWQALADGDPDVDAIYRLTTNNKSCIFREEVPLVLDSGYICPFNSQNTLVIKDLFPLLYLPTYVTFRFTDILRGLIAQPIMWEKGYNLGFTKATVVQERNVHNYFDDFLSEIPMYKHTKEIIELVNLSVSKNNSIIDNLFNSYDKLLLAGIIDSKEMITLEGWIRDLERIGYNR